MLEDESGRLRLTGSFLGSCLLVTGCIVAVMGTENANGDFEVIDLKLPELAPQPERWSIAQSDAASKKKAGKKEKAGKIAIVSTLGVSGDSGDTMALDLLVEYLLGESASPAEQDKISSISRLLIAGNSLSSANPIPGGEEPIKKPSAVKKYGYDASAYNPAPTDRLDSLLESLLPSIPITVIPGDQDPTHTSLPQQPMHSALFPRSRAYMAVPNSDESAWFDAVTNPWEGDVDGWRVLATGGQPIDDVFKYVEGDDRMEMMEATLHWRLSAPTAPDTLCEFPTNRWTKKPTNNCRVLSFPRQGSICHRRNSSHLHCRQPTSFRVHCCRRSRRPEMPNHIGTTFQGYQRITSAGYGDA
jgi:DNA polymerase delta subunit 2